MREGLGFPQQALANIAEQIREETGGTAPIGTLSQEELVSEMRKVGGTSVQDVTFNTTINPALTVCRKFTNIDVDVAGMSVFDFIDSAPQSHLRNCCNGGEVSLHIISWSGNHMHPFGIDVEARFGEKGTIVEKHKLATLDNNGQIRDIHNTVVGVYDFLTDEYAEGTVILAVIARSTPLDDRR